MQIKQTILTITNINLFKKEKMGFADYSNKKSDKPSLNYNDKGEVESATHGEIKGEAYYFTNKSEKPIKINGEYLPTETTAYEMVNELQLEHVKVLYTGNWNQEIQDSFVFNNFIYGTKVPHEGIVIKDISGDRKKVAKVINPDYLIYGEKNDVGDSH